MKMSSSSAKSRNRSAKVRRNNLRFCSTPVLENPHRCSSVTISTIEDNSSSSATTKHRRILQKTVQNREPERRKKKKKTKVVRNRRKGRLKVIKDSDSDWETKSIKSVHGGTSEEQDSLKRVTSEDEVLFRDIRSPEVLRKSQYIADRQLESPLFRPQRRQVLGPRKSVKQQDEPLVLKDLPSLNLRDFDSDGEEEDFPLCLNKEAITKTYPAPEKKRKTPLKPEKFKWLVDVKVPTASSDLLWDNFVTNNHKEISRYLARPKNRSKKALFGADKSEVQQLCAAYVTEHVEDKEISGDYNKERKGIKRIRNRIRNKELLKPASPKLEVVRGHWDKRLKKWVRVADEYAYPEREDTRFEKDEETGARMPFGKFRRIMKEEKLKKQRLNISKDNPDEDTSTSKTDLYRFPANVSKPPRNERLSKKRKVIPHGDSKPRSKTYEIMNIPDTDLRRINKIRQFASRLNAKEKEMSSNEPSLKTTKEESVASWLEASRLKRAKEWDISETQVDTKRRRMASKESPATNKPKVRTIKLLTTVKFTKVNNRWHINA